MRPQLWFVMPAHGRLELTRLCLAHLRVTCNHLTDFAGIDATCVVVADDENLESAREYGFWAVEQENVPLGRKFNDGIELAAQQGAGYVTPFGSDNWVDWSAFAELPEDGTVISRRRSAIVHEHGDRMCLINVRYDGGDGLRTFPTSLFARCAHRPAADFARRAVDTSIIERLRRFTGWRRQFVYRDHHELQIVGWQSPRGEQLNDYNDLKTAFGERESQHPFRDLALRYDREHLDAMRAFYARRLKGIR